MRILFALSGLHRCNRGAEVAFIEVAKGLCELGETVTLIGSGTVQGHFPYQFFKAGSIERQCFERFPFFPILRNEYCYEELTFVPSLAWRYRPQDYDVTVTCGYPFTNWLLRRPVLRGLRPLHVFVTQNGDWPAVARNAEYRFFGCDGLVCINPDFLERNIGSWNCRLIPNGADCDRFRPTVGARAEFGIPEDRFVVLMVSALIHSKRVNAGIEAVSQIPDAHLVIAGDGPLRDAVAKAAEKRLPARFTQLSIAPEKMPLLYQSADVFLHCSKEEAFGSVFIEAMACGLPVVAHDSPRLRWIVGENEFLLDTSDAVNIARALEVARHSGAAGKSQRVERAGRFSWSHIAEQYRDFFYDLIAGHNANLRGEVRARAASKR
jgi:glycosyltransferase involved in cell wall biosynthesis